MPSRSRQQSNPARRKQAAGPQSGERLQKVLAASGVGSRRACEELIAEGRVEIDRQTVRELGTRVDPEEHEIRVDGVPLAVKRRVYYLLNKPEGVVTTNRDPSGRPRVIDLVRSDERLFAVGRLDMSTSGLILLTNDGELANRLAHPRYGVQKTYMARVAGEPDREMLEKLKAGVHLAEGVARVADVKVKKRHRQSTELEIVLEEGKNREIRRVLAAVGHKVVRLKRIAIGPLRLGELPTGAYRQLGPDEVRQLERNLKEGKGTRVKRSRPGKRPFGKPSSNQTGGTSREGRERAGSGLGRGGKPVGNALSRRAGSPEKRERPAPVARPPRSAKAPKQGAVLTYDQPPAMPPRGGDRPDVRRKKFKGKRRP